MIMITLAIMIIMTIIENVIRIIIVIRP